MSPHCAYRTPAHRSVHSYERQARPRCQDLGRTAQRDAGPSLKGLGNPIDRLCDEVGDAAGKLPEVHADEGGSSPDHADAATPPPSC